MNRRGFLGWLLASPALFTLDPKAFLWAPKPVTVLPPLQSGAIVGLDAMTRYLLGYLGERWSGRIVEGHLIGHAGLTHHIGASFGNPPVNLDAHGLDPERYLDPIGAKLLHSVRELRAVKFGELDVRLAGACTSRWTNKHTGLSVRGVSQYYIQLDAECVRFEVLCGAA